MSQSEKTFKTFCSPSPSAIPTHISQSEIGKSNQESDGRKGAACSRMKRDFIHVKPSRISDEADDCAAHSGSVRVKK